MLNFYISELSPTWEHCTQEYPYADHRPRPIGVAQNVKFQRHNSVVNIDTLGLTKFPRQPGDNKTFDIHVNHDRETGPC